MTTYAVSTPGTFTLGKCHFTIENVMQYNRNVNLPQVNVSHVNTALVHLCTTMICMQTHACITLTCNL